MVTDTEAREALVDALDGAGRVKIIAQDLETFSRAETLEASGHLALRSLVLMTGGAVTDRAQRFLAKTSLSLLHKPIESAALAEITAAAARRRRALTRAPEPEGAPVATFSDLSPMSDPPVSVRA